MVDLTKQRPCPVHQPEKPDCKQDAGEHEQSPIEPDFPFTHGHASFSPPNILIGHILDLYAGRRRSRHQVFTPYGLLLPGG